MSFQGEDAISFEEELERDVKEFLLHFASELERLSLATIDVDDEGGWVSVNAAPDEDALKELYFKDNRYLPAAAFFSGPYWIPPFEEDVEVEVKELAEKSASDPWEVEETLKQIEGIEVKEGVARFPKEFLDSFREWKLFHIHVTARKNELLSYTEVFYRLRWNGNESLPDTYKEVSQKVLDIVSPYTSGDGNFICLDLLLNMEILTKFLERSGRGAPEEG
ncbi:MAG: hypothetical protein DRN28_05335 [Thermoplasmata archaeon]|nr:MAG: hypothetical protein DRN28_05335 [Thermoplasmata archaeon]